MENRLQNKISVDVAADTTSLDSLSFAGLVCIQDQQKQSPPNNTAKQIHEQDPEFEFSQSITHSTTTSPTTDPPPDLFISKGQLLPQPHLFQTKQYQAINQQHGKGSVPATRARTNRSTGTEVPGKQYQEQRKQVKEHTAPKLWFGRKLLKSFVSPCRECQVTDSTVKAHKLRGQNAKLN